MRAVGAVVAVRRGGGGGERERVMLWTALVWAMAMLCMLTACGGKEEQQREESQRFSFPELQKDVPRYELRIPEATLALFEANPYAEEQPAVFVHDGQERQVKVRLRGSSARFFPKKSWRIEFPEGERFDGRRKHNLVAEFQDRTMMSEKLGYDLMLAMGVPAPRTKYVRLSINGQYQGVYLDIERVDQTFAQAHGIQGDDPTIYRCGAKDCEMKLWRTEYQQDWQKKTNEDTGKEDIRALMHVINRTPEPELPTVLAEHLELERYLRTMAVDALISNNIAEDSQSYFIHDSTTGRWTYVTWDLNNNDARWWPTYGLSMKPVVEHPLFYFSLADGWTERMYTRRKNHTPGYLPAFSNLNTRIVYNPELRERLMALIERGITELFTPDVIHARLDAMHALIAPHMEADPHLNLGPNGESDPDGLAKFHAGLPFLKAYAEQRAAFLRGELERFRELPQGLRLSAVNPSEGWVELHNPGTQEVSTAGLVLTTDLRRTVPELRKVESSAVLAERRVPANGTVRFTREELGLTLPAEGEVGLFNGVSVVGALDVLFYGALPEGQHYARNGSAPYLWERR